VGRYFPSNCHHIAPHGTGRLETAILGPSAGTNEMFQVAAKRSFDEFQINTWRHPLGPYALVEKSVHFGNLLLAHFHYAARGLAPLTLDWNDEKHKELVGSSVPMPR